MQTMAKCGLAWPGRIAGAVLATVMAVPAFGQEALVFPVSGEAKYDSIQHIDSTPATPEAYGLVDANVLTIGAWSFAPIVATDYSLLQNSSLFRYCLNLCLQVAQIQLPSGVRIIGIETDLLDSSASGSIGSGILRCDKGVSLCDNFLAVANSGNVATPGDVLMASVVDETVMNLQFTYYALVSVIGNSATTGFRSVRIFYKRQISPAPGTATFSDVPKGHTFFAGIEALAASGITGGCGGGKYCPDDPVTRGQMATFLARALGLHWEN